jgi:hypothetical protein
MMTAAMVHTVGEPIERKQHPRTAYEAKFSVPYTFASALLVDAILEKKSLIAPAAAFVHTKYGRQLSEEALVNRGSRERPFSPAEVLQKFQDNAGDALPRDARDQPAAKLLGLE